MTDTAAPATTITMSTPTAAITATIPPETPGEAAAAADGVCAGRGRGRAGDVNCLPCGLASHCW